jgi:AbrB family looped-hinge helix DNA binding protein
MVTITEEVKVMRVGNSLRVAIPSVICKALDIAEGDEVHMETTDHEILLKRLPRKKRG